MKSDPIKFGGTLLIRAIIAAILAGVVYMSVAFIFTSFGTQVIGYTVYKQEAGSNEMEKVGDFYYSELEDLENQAENGETSTDQETGVTTTFFRQSIRSDMKPWLKVLSIIVAEICMIGIYTSMLYVSAWERGNKDIKKVQYDHQKEDLFFGLKSSLYASIPICIAFFVLIGSKLGLWLPSFGSTFKIFVLPFFPLVAKIIPTQATAIAWWVFPILLVFMAVKPLTCHYAYKLGYNDKMLRNFFIYKKKKKKKKKSV